MPNKTEREDPLGFFNIYVEKLQKIRRDPLVEKIAQYRKKSKGGTLWSRPELYVTLETFLVQFLGATGTIWHFVEFLVELFWSLQVVLENTDEKP